MNCFGVKSRHEIMYSQLAKVPIAASWEGKLLSSGD